MKSKPCFTWLKKPLFSSLRNLYSTKFRKLLLAYQVYKIVSSITRLTITWKIHFLLDSQLLETVATKKKNFFSYTMPKAHGFWTVYIALETRGNQEKQPEV